MAALIKRVVEAMSQAIGEATDASARTASYIFWRADRGLCGVAGASTYPPGGTC